MDCGLGYLFRARTAKISCYPNQRRASEQETLLIKVTITPSKWISLTIPEFPVIIKSSIEDKQRDLF